MRKDELAMIPERTRRACESPIQREVKALLRWAERYGKSPLTPRAKAKVPRASYAAWLNAVQFRGRNGQSLVAVARQTPELCALAVAADGAMLRYVEKQTESLCLLAAINDGLSLQYVEKQLPNICLAAVSSEWKALQYVERQSEDICIVAVQTGAYALQYVRKQTPSLCLLAVASHGFALQYVEKQTPEICLAAVQQHGEAMQYVKKQTPELCLEAVQECGLALQYVRKQTPEICIAAVQQTPHALKHVKRQTEEICLAALAESGRGIGRVIKVWTQKVFDVWLAGLYSSSVAVRNKIHKRSDAFLIAAIRSNTALEGGSGTTRSVALRVLRERANSSYVLQFVAAVYDTPLLADSDDADTAIFVEMPLICSGLRVLQASAGVTRRVQQRI